MNRRFIVEYCFAVAGVFTGNKNEAITGEVF